MAIFKGKSRSKDMESCEAPKGSLAIAYAMKRKGKRMAEGGEVDESQEEKKPYEADIQALESANDDLVDRIMAKRYSEGGMVANDSEPTADEDSAEFDDLALEDHLSEHETGANSGDELGDKRLSEDDHDVVERIMRSRAKKDRLPRPL